MVNCLFDPEYSGRIIIKILNFIIKVFGTKSHRAREKSHLSGTPLRNDKQNLSHNKLLNLNLYIP